jgi:hypothetical protein
MGIGAFRDSSGPTGGKVKAVKRLNETALKMAISDFILNGLSTKIMQKPEK